MLENDDSLAQYIPVSPYVVKLLYSLNLLFESIRMYTTVGLIKTCGTNVVWYVISTYQMKCMRSNFLIRM